MNSNDWQDVQTTPPPFDVPILVTDGVDVVSCKLLKADPHILMGNHGIIGYEYEFNFDVEEITHWQEIVLPGIGN